MARLRVLVALAVAAALLASSSQVRREERESSLVCCVKCGARRRRRAAAVGAQTAALRAAGCARPSTQTHHYNDPPHTQRTQAINEADAAAQARDEEEGKMLVEQYLLLTEAAGKGSGDSLFLKPLMAPAYQILRADGSRETPVRSGGDRGRLGGTAGGWKGALSLVSFICRRPPSSGLFARAAVLQKACAHHPPTTLQTTIKQTTRRCLLHSRRSRRPTSTPMRFRTCASRAPTLTVSLETGWVDWEPGGCLWARNGPTQQRRVQNNNNTTTATKQQHPQQHKHRRQSSSRATSCASTRRCAATR